MHCFSIYQSSFFRSSVHVLLSLICRQSKITMKIITIQADKINIKVGFYTEYELLTIALVLEIQF